MPIITRSTKGSALTQAELDGNFTQLVSDIGGKQATLPTQTGQSGKVLGTNGTTLSWTAIPTELPSFTGNDGKLLSLSSGSAVWITPPVSLPSQTGNSGKYLTTDGTNASWVTISGGGGGASLPTQTGQAGKVLGTDGTNASWIDPTPAADLTTNRSATNLDSDYLLQNPTTTNYTLTIPSGLAAGFSVAIQQLSTGTLSFAAGSGVTILGIPLTTVQNGDIISLTQSGTDTYIVKRALPYQVSTNYSVVLKSDGSGNWYWGQEIPTFTLSTNLTVSNTHNNSTIYNTGTSAYTVTIPSGLPSYYGFRVQQNSSGSITISAGSGVTLVGTPSSTLISGDSLYVKWINANTYSIQSIGVPAFTSADQGKVLTVNVGGTAAYWQPTATSAGLRTIIASDTAVISDDGIVVKCNSTNDIVFTIPPNSSVAFPTMATITLLRYGTGLISFAAGSGVTIRDPGITPPNRYGTISIMKIGTDEWNLL